MKEFVFEDNSRVSFDLNDEFHINVQSQDFSQKPIKIISTHVRLSKSQFNELINWIGDQLDTTTTT